MIPDAMATQYFRKSGDDKIINGETIVNEHGFMVYHIYDNKFVMLQVFGDGQYWMDKATEMAMELDLKLLFCAVRRSYKAYCRKYGWKLKGYVLEKEV